VTSRPLLFSTPMVRALLRGAKTETRRLRWRHGGPGDRLWVREAFAVPPGSTERREVVYRADWTGTDADARAVRWTSSIFMPRWASRLELEILDVHQEPLQAITWQAVRAEGIDRVCPSCGVPSKMRVADSCYFCERALVREYSTLWDTLNPRDLFASNPTVWVVRFKIL
jgi:hypothetical protein